ncbi:hypothetical protein ES703_94375 [subsurface metagenome]
MNLRQAVAFAILMSHHGGIYARSPKYILEKVAMCGSLPVPETILDAGGRGEMRDFARRWSLNWDWEKDQHNFINAEVNPKTGELIVKDTKGEE